MLVDMHVKYMFGSVGLYPAFMDMQHVYTCFGFTSMHVTMQ